jgi:hypothetical protein
MLASENNRDSERRKAGLDPGDHLDRAQPLVRLVGGASGVPDFNQPALLDDRGEGRVQERRHGERSRLWQALDAGADPAEHQRREDQRAYLGIGDALQQPRRLREPARAYPGQALDLERIANAAGKRAEAGQAIAHADHDGS